MERIDNTTRTSISVNADLVRRIKGPPSNSFGPLTLPSLKSGIQPTPQIDRMVVFEDVGETAWEPSAAPSLT